jgi:hypothetical protein
MSDLAKRVRAKYPGTYDDLDDAALEKAVLAKHPEYADLAQPEQKAGPAPAAPKPGYLDGQGMFGETNILGPLVKVAKAAWNHPVQTGAIAGGALGAAATAPVSIPAALVAAAGAGLGAAGGAGLGSILNAVRGGEHGPTTASGVGKTMAMEGAAGALGEGAGQGAAKILKVGGKFVYKTALRPSMNLQREFGDVADVGLREAASSATAAPHATSRSSHSPGTRPSRWWPTRKRPAPLPSPRAKSPQSSGTCSGRAGCRRNSGGPIHVPRCWGG